MNDPCGTYLLTKAFSEGRLNLVIYLLPRNLFLFIGCWQGFELTYAAGIWKKEADRIQLKGLGKIESMDTHPFDDSIRVFERSFVLATTPDKSWMTALDEPKDWSLLSWRGPFDFKGPTHFVDIPNSTLPQAWAELHSWVMEFLTSRNFTFDELHP